MAGWGGAERPEAPIAGEEEAGRGRAIGAPGRGHPPLCVTSLPAAHFQATGRGREQTLGCPGKLYYLGGGDHRKGQSGPWGESAEGICAELQDQEKGLSPQSVVLHTLINQL